jgi:hypothetical protein
MFPLGHKIDNKDQFVNYCGAASRLTAKLISRLISEKTCLVAFASPRGGVSAPDGVLLSGGDPREARSASPAPVPGNATRLPSGDVRARALVVGGSISSSVRNDVCSSSGFVLVMVMKKSSRSFCSARGVPFKSMICKPRVH